MAQKDDAKAPAKKGSGAIKILLIVIVSILLVGGSVGATLFLTGALHKSPEAAEEEPAAKTAAHGGGGHAKTKGGGGHGAAAGPEQPPVYQPLDPPFIINFEDQGALRYLQIGLSVMSRDKLVIDAVNNNMPQIRNDLILLFGNQKLEFLASNEGKEQLRAQALEQVQAVLNKEIGEPGIEAIYYTAFVMQ
ncbi:MAG TPA: flagellar basal body-associated FliL family protein [Candidatus Competibacter sp.]|nr:flagellar basal body-associated FliL family protein [Candidatus Competibacter sp.]